VYARDDQYVGFWTILLYWNENYEGGETVIYDTKNRVEHTIQPEVGKVFAFYHFQLHAGLEVEAGNKLLLRTEIMFALVEKERLHT
jgi:prolyl 4-hydroxylase